VYLLASDQNLGFAGGCNLGIKGALEQGANWMLLLNNDTFVAPTFLSELENVVKCDSRFAIIGPVIFYHDQPDRIWYFGDRLIPGTLATISLYCGQHYHDQLPPLVPVDFISGCCMLIRRDVFETVGLLDTTFFMYGEEVDFCWRARAAGFRLAVATRAKMWHKISASANRDKPASRYLRIRNQVRFYRTYARGMQIPVMFGFTLARAIRIVVSDLVHRQPSLISPLIRGWINGWQSQIDSARYTVDGVHIL
jgi:GT2 family glycosyltransferase